MSPGRRQADDDRTQSRDNAGRRLTLEERPVVAVAVMIVSALLGAGVMAGILVIWKGTFELSDFLAVVVPVLGVGLAVRYGMRQDRLG